MLNAPKCYLLVDIVIMISHYMFMYVNSYKYTSLNGKILLFIFHKDVINMLFNSVSITNRIS